MTTFDYKIKMTLKYLRIKKLPSMINKNFKMNLQNSDKKKIENATGKIFLRQIPLNKNKIENNKPMINSSKIMIFILLLLPYE